MSDAKSLIKKLEQRNSLISMMGDSMNEIIFEFNAETKSYIMKMAPEEFNVTDAL